MIRVELAAGTVAADGARMTDAFLITDLAALLIFPASAVKQASFDCATLVLGVFDGNGVGDAARAVAARVAAAVEKRLESHLPRRPAPSDVEPLAEALRIADGDPVAAGKASRDLRGGGTTATVLAVEAGGIRIAHVGDSRAYLWRAGQLTRLTQDHTLLATLLASGDLLPADAADVPAQERPHAGIGMGDGLEVATSTSDVRSGDVLLLCTDGLTDVAESTIDSILRGAAAPADACQALIDAALAAASPCVTVIVARIDATSAGPPTA